MKPIPVDFHLGPLVIHTYGIGLAITFYISYKYFEKRLKDHNYPITWLNTAFIWIIVAAVIGARIVHVIANFFTDYEHNLIGILEIWNGGLSSYGGLVGGLIAGIVIMKKKCPELNAWVAADLVTPVLIAGWAIGRLLGPQLMIAGGGKPTSGWFGMYYAGEVGKRIPAPIFQAIEDFVIYFVVLYIEKRLEKGPLAATMLSGVILWNIARFFDEFLWLDYPNRLWDAVEGASLIAVALGSIALYIIVIRWSKSTKTPVKRYNEKATDNDLSEKPESAVT
jgi:phosphatidylglycerol:prolipoprotein diacylglycerol transferase